MEKQLDLRVQKTYQSLFDAFMKLLEEKTFEEITINELCEKASTRRATFYKHFSDKYDFCSFMISQLHKQFIMNAETVDCSQDPLAYYSHLLERGIDFIDNNERLIRSARKNHNSIFFTMLDTSDDIAKELQKHIEEDVKRGVHFIAEPELMTQVFIGTISQSINWWFKQNKKISKEELIDKLTTLFSQYAYDEKKKMS